MYIYSNFILKTLMLKILENKNFIIFIVILFTLTSCAKEGFFKSIGDVNQLVDVLVPVDPLEFGFIPSTSIRVSMSGSRESRENLIGITFTPMSGFGPWEIDYNVSIAKIIAGSENVSDETYEVSGSNQPIIFQ